MKEEQHKATIETMINTVALAITAFGVNCIITKDNYGFIVITFGAFLEWFKYYGRNKKWW